MVNVNVTSLEYTFLIMLSVFVVPAKIAFFRLSKRIIFIIFADFIRSGICGPNLQLTRK